jgi:hypothetical protein
LTEPSASADAFEPPPPSREAAQSQAAAEHAAPVDPIAAFAGSPNGTPVADHDAPAESAGMSASRSVAAPSRESAPEPPVHIAPMAAPAKQPATDDDPIARFANGG